MTEAQYLALPREQQLIIGRDILRARKVVNLADYRAVILALAAARHMRLKEEKPA